MEIKIPTDGKIKEGAAKIDEAMISGEAEAVKKKDGDEVIGGTIILDGSIKNGGIKSWSTKQYYRKLLNWLKLLKAKSQPSKN